MMQGDSVSWDSFLPTVQYGLNCRISSRHRSMPFSLFFGRAANQLKDYRGVQSNLWSDADLLSRARLMLDAVYPSIGKVTDVYNAIVKDYHDTTRDDSYIPS